MCIKSVEGGLCDAFYNEFFGVKIKVNLWWGIILGKFLIYCFCFKKHLLRVFAFLEVFIGHPKFNIFLTELGFKKSGKSIFMGKKFVK